MRYLSLFFILLFAFSICSPVSAATKIVDLNFESTNTLIDSAGNLTNPAFIRNSASTDDNGVLKHGRDEQLVSVDGQEDLTTWWVQTNATNTTGESIVADSGYNEHYISSPTDFLESNKTYMFLAKIKAEDKDYAAISFYTGSAYHYASFNAGSGNLGTTVGTISSGMDGGIDGDGYYRFYAICTVSAVTSASKVSIYAANGDLDFIFSGDGSTDSISIKEIMILELPSNNEMGPDLYDQEETNSITRDDVTVIGTVYEIVGQNTLDFTTVGAPDNNIGTVFIANAVDTLGISDFLDEIVQPHSGTFGYPYSAGPQLFTDGSCSTDQMYEGIGWSHDAVNSEYDCDGSQVLTTELYETGILVKTPGLHRITYTVRNYSAGSIQAIVSGKLGTSRSADGTYSQYLWAGFGGAVGVRASSDFVGSVTDFEIRYISASYAPYSGTVIELDDDGDNEAVRATYVNNSSGFYYDFSNAYDLSENIVVGDTYEVRFSYKVGAGSTAYRFTGFGPTYTSSYKSNTSYVEAVHMFKASSSVPRMVLVGFSSGDTFYIKDVTLKRLPVLAKIEPRDYENSSSLQAEPIFSEYGLRIQGYGVNLIEWSEDFTKWTNSNTTDTKNIDGPDGGTSNATTLTATAGNGTLKYTTPDSIESSGDIFSIWLRRISGSGNIDITQNDGITWDTKSLTSEWERFYIRGTETDPVVGIRIVTTGDSIGIWGADLKQSRLLSNYIPTIGSRVVRATEESDLDTTGYEFDMSSTITDALQDAGTLIVMLKAQSNHNTFNWTASRGLIAVRDNYYSIMYFSSTEGQVLGNDSAHTSRILFSWSDQDNLIFVNRFDKDLNEGAGYMHVVGKVNDTWNFDTTYRTEFDGAFNVGSNLQLAVDNEDNLVIQRIIMYDDYLSNDDLTNEIWNLSSGSGGYGIRSMRMSTTLK